MILLPGWPLAPPELLEGTLRLFFGRRMLIKSLCVHPMSGGRPERNLGCLKGMLLNPKEGGSVPPQASKKQSWMPACPPAPPTGAPAGAI